MKISRKHIFNENNRKGIFQNLGGDKQIYWANVPPPQLMQPREYPAYRGLPISLYIEF